MRKDIEYLSDNTVRLRGPVNEDTNTAISAGTCTARLFHDRKDTRLKDDLAVLATVLVVFDASQYAVFDEVLIEMNDGSWHDAGFVTSVDLTANTITITNPSPLTGIGKKNRVAVQLGADIAMTAYGVPVVGTFDWGFRGTIESTHDDLSPGIPVRIERVLDASGVVLTSITRHVVSGGT